MDDDFSNKYYNEYTSKEGLRSETDSRKPTLTLAHLNKLKKIKAVRKLDDIQRRGLLKTMYGAAEEDSGGL